ncbi:MAG: TauD/TfdA dioxygenase family protein, partial [Hyphomicrobiales bacterium]
MTSSLPRAQAGAGHITVRPITGTMGAELVGLDLSRPLSPDELSAVKSAFAEHLVLVFRDQQLDIAALERF